MSFEHTLHVKHLLYPVVLEKVLAGQASHVYSSLFVPYPQYWIKSCFNTGSLHKNKNHTIYYVSKIKTPLWAGSQVDTFHIVCTDYRQDPSSSFHRNMIHHQMKSSVQNIYHNFRLIFILLEKLPEDSYLQ